MIKTIKSLGNDLLSQAVTHQVPSALTGLTSGFGMWPGVPLSHQSLNDFIHIKSEFHVIYRCDVMRVFSELRNARLNWCY